MLAENIDTTSKLIFNTHRWVPQSTGNYMQLKRKIEKESMEMYFKCKLDEKFNNIFETDISMLDKSRYHVDCSVEVNWSDELEKDLPTIVFSLTRDMLYVKEIKRLYFDNYDELLKYIFDEKKFLEKGKYTF